MPSDWEKEHDSRPLPSMNVDYPTDDEVQTVMDLHRRAANSKSAMAPPPPRVSPLHATSGGGGSGFGSSTGSSSSPSSSSSSSSSCSSGPSCSEASDACPTNVQTQAAGAKRVRTVAIMSLQQKRSKGKEVKRKETVLLGCEESDSD